MLVQRMQLALRCSGHYSCSLSWQVAWTRLSLTCSGCVQTSAVQVFLAVINLILCTQRMPCENSMKTCIGSILAVSILVLEVCSMLYHNVSAAFPCHRVLCPLLPACHG